MPSLISVLMTISLLLAIAAGTNSQASTACYCAYDTELRCGLWHLGPDGSYCVSTYIATIYVLKLFGDKLDEFDTRKECEHALIGAKECQ